MQCSHSRRTKKTSEFYSEDFFPCVCSIYDPACAAFLLQVHCSAASPVCEIVHCCCCCCYFCRLSNQPVKPESQLARLQFMAMKLSTTLCGPSNADKRKSRMLKINLRSGASRTYLTLSFKSGNDLVSKYDKFFSFVPSESPLLPGSS